MELDRDQDMPAFSDQPEDGFASPDTEARQREYINLNDLISARRAQEQPEAGSYEESPQEARDSVPEDTEAQLDQTSYLQAWEREQIMKRLVSSQETYIKELEGKNQELSQNLAQKATEATSEQVAEWAREKQMLQALVEKNQEMAEDLEAAMRNKEAEF